MGEPIDGMNPNAYQEWTKKFELKSSVRELMLKNALGLCEEAGEVAKIIGKWAFHKRVMNVGDLEKELGDVAWYMTRIAQEAGIPLSSVFGENVVKLERRYGPTGYTPEAAAAKADQKHTQPSPYANVEPVAIVHESKGRDPKEFKTDFEDCG
jgi:NTP pyrophosphatase (non-canonical NTP hydrolase)